MIFRSVAVVWANARVITRRTKIAGLCHQSDIILCKDFLNSRLYEVNTVNDPMWVETMIITASFLAIMMTLVMSVLWLERYEG